MSRGGKNRKKRGRYWNAPAPKAGPVRRLSRDEVVAAFGVELTRPYDPNVNTAGYYLWEKVPKALPHRRHVTPYSLYVLVDPRDGGVRYVGLTAVGVSIRAAWHHIEQHTDMMREWFASLKADGVRAQAEWLTYCPDERTMCREERVWIAWFRKRAFLLNASRGGELGSTRKTQSVAK